MVHSNFGYIFKALTTSSIRFVDWMADLAFAVDVTVLMN